MPDEPCGAIFCFYFICLGECCKSVLLSSSRNNCRNTKVHMTFHQHNDWIFIFVWIYPLNAAQSLIVCVCVCVGLQAAGLQQPDGGEQGLAVRPADSAAAPPRPQRHQQDPTWRLGVLPETRRAVSPPFFPSPPLPLPPPFLSLFPPHSPFTLWTPNTSLRCPLLPSGTPVCPSSHSGSSRRQFTHTQSSIFYALPAGANVKALPAHITHPFASSLFWCHLSQKTPPSGSPTYFSYGNPLSAALSFMWNTTLPTNLSHFPPVNTHSWKQSGFSFVVAGVYSSGQFSVCNVWSVFFTDRLLFFPPLALITRTWE